MANEYACFAPIPHRTSVPDSDSRVIRTGIKKMRRWRVPITDSIDISLMIRQPKDRLSSLDIINHDRRIIWLTCASYDFPTISGESDRENLKKNQLARNKNDWATQSLYSLKSVDQTIALGHWARQNSGRTDQSCPLDLLMQGKRHCSWSYTLGICCLDSM